MAGRPCKVCGLKKTHPEAFRLITEEISKEKGKAKIKQLLGTLTERFSLKVNGVNIHRHKEHLSRKTEKNSPKEKPQSKVEVYSKEGDLQYTNIKEIIDNLNPKHKEFCELYVNDCKRNGSKAYKEVYGTDIVDQTARGGAWAIRTNQNNLLYIKYLDEIRKEELGLNVNYVLENLKLVAERCMEAEPVKNKDGEIIGDYVFQHAGANKAIELIGKHLQMWDKKEQPTDQNLYKQILEDLLNNKLNPFTAGIELEKAGLEMPEVVKIAMRKVDPSILDKPVILDDMNLDDLTDEELDRLEIENNS